MTIAKFKSVQLLLLLAVIGLSFMLVPGTVFAHASVVQITPEANSKLEESPAKITITFNERLDDGLYYIKVLDQQGDNATTNQAGMTPDHTGIELSLPKLQEGIYVVSYHVISADGHPVGGSYPMTIGNPPPGQNPSAVVSPVSHNHALSGSLSEKALLQYASRGLWYLAVLALAGWVVWLRLPGAGGRSVRESLSVWTLNLQRVQLLALLILIFTHIEDLLGGGGLEELWRLFSATSIGISWLLLLALSLIGFVLVGKSVLLDVLWAILLLGAKSFSGHAASFSPQGLTIALDFLHLAAAAIWVGGLVLMLVKWRKQSVDMLRFIRSFSNMAFLSLIVLIVTGSASVLLFLPSLRYLLYSQWGILLLVKTGVVLLVIVVGAILRSFLRKQKEARLRQWVKADVTLMVIIVLLVGLITYMAPIPANEPLQWHVMGETEHMSADITPKVQGNNTFVTKIWLPEQMGAPKQVQMILRYLDQQELAPIQIPLKAYQDQTQEESFGFSKFSYQAEGAYLPFRGNWELEVRVMDAEDNEKVYHKEFIVY